VSTCTWWDVDVETDRFLNCSREATHDLNCNGDYLVCERHACRHSKPLAAPVPAKPAERHVDPDLRADLAPSRGPIALGDLCPHSQLLRQCPICEVEAERNALQARIDRAVEAGTGFGLYDRGQRLKAVLAILTGRDEATKEGT